MGEVSQQPMCPHRAQRRRWTHHPPAASHSWQPVPLGGASGSISSGAVMAFIIVRRGVIGHEGPGVGSPPDPDARGGGATMANPVHLMPLRDGEGERAGTLLPWLAGCPSAHGVPDRLPEPRPLPTARAVVGALV